jgi:Gpi18-like mannosyltransferase
MVTLLSWMINDKQGPFVARMYEYWNHWDTGHYIRIAQEGYTAQRPDTDAFFPLFPLLLRVADPVIPGPTPVAALVLANVACVGALLVLHRFAIHEFDVPTADRVLLFLMAWPTAFFLSAGYNESLFVLLSASAFMLMRQRRWWAAGIVGALASATRLSGVLLVIGFAAEFIRLRGWRPRRLDGAAILIMPVGLSAFCAYCWATLHDPLAFSHAQGEWGRQVTLPWTGMVHALDTIYSYPLLRPVAVHNFVDVVSTMVTIVLLVEAAVGPWLRRDQLPLILYSMASFLVVLTSPVGGDFPLQGSPRYALEFIPIFFLLARLGAARVFERIYLLPAIGLQAVFLLTYINNVWVA